MELFAHGSVVAYPLQVIALRWSAGAKPGKTHLFTAVGCDRPFDVSEQCVVDDFGNLVVVPDEA